MHLARLRSALPALALAAFGAAPAAQSQAAFVARFVGQSLISPPPSGGVVFLGSSSIRRWERLSRDFADVAVVQRGIGGSALASLVDWVDELVTPYSPAAVVVYGGSNGIAPPEPPPTEQNTPQEEFELFVDLVERIHAQQSQLLPPIPVIYIAITPSPARWFLWPEAAQVNALVAQYAASQPSVWFVDTSPAFLATGMPPAAYLFDPDQLHLSQLGYDLWTAHLRPVLTAAMAPQQAPGGAAVELARGTRILVDLGAGDGVEGHLTVGPDANGNLWNNWFDLPGGVKVLAGERRNDLATTGGAPTGIDLVLSGGWRVGGVTLGGLEDPAPSALGRFAVATATEDCFYSVDSDDPAGLSLTGLDPGRLYHLRLFASLDVPDPQRTRYAVKGAGAERSVELQTSGAGLGSGGSPNGNVSTVALLRGLRPDRYGQLFVDAQPAQGVASTLALFELEVGPRIYGERSPSIPAAR